MDLDIKRVLAAKPGEPVDVKLNRLTTVWGESLDPNNVLSEHPRPRMQRDEWTCLNGWWEYAIVESSSARDLWKKSKPPKVWDGSILVPFSPEAALSGVGRQLTPTQLLWYRREIELDGLVGGMRSIVHFEAVDYACAVYVNGVRAATHVGAYLPFDVDITKHAHEGANILELCVYDPSEQGTQLRGKQRIRRGNMWYTAQSGIWQTVWMEQVPARRLTFLDAQGDPDTGTLHVVAQVSAQGGELRVALLDEQGAMVAHGSTVATGGTAVALDVALDRGALDSLRVWEPDDPYLYTLHVVYDTDIVRSYTAFRTVGIEPDDAGVPRVCLNHKPLFVRGLLDQGYWPDGLMTAPSDEALVADIQAAREAGFNMLRKHIKVESERWYWHCDRLGMLVWQDMVSGGGIPGEWTSANIPTLVRRSWKSFSDTRPHNWRRLGAADEAYRTEWLNTARATVAYLASHPCIATWVVFNESWGQFCSAEMTEELRIVDPTRPFIATSGWYDQGAGDYYAVHNYFRSMQVYKDRRKRAFMLNEFGGLTCPIEGHTSVDTVYGYDTYEDVATWREALDELLGQVDALEKDGLCGFVYTQISDVEEETNGLLTYDRRVNKLLV